MLIKKNALDAEQEIAVDQPVTWLAYQSTRSNERHACCKNQPHTREEYALWKQILYNKEASVFYGAHH
tara:strand:- start:43 stop:246 length:204 start_codon:yes stop_codon:yes gene_type:complete